MVYVERRPVEALRPWVRLLWYCSAPRLGHARERVLPNGCMQVLVNLAGETLTECDEGGPGERPVSGALLTGARVRYEMVATRDLEELAGAVLEPGGFGRMFRVRADAVRAGGVGLDELWAGAGATLAERLRTAPTVGAKLQVLERVLGERVGAGAERNWVVDAAMERMRCEGMTVRECARSVGVSERRLLEVFREEVGVGPKTWMRVGRFQQAVRALERGKEVRWAELALRCGYYDQAHFANEFRAFSGIDPTTYSATRGIWRNHLTAE